MRCICYQESKYWKTTEIHILRAISNYQSFSLHTDTCLHETDYNVEFALAMNQDVFAIKKANTKPKTTEIYVLSAASKYKSFSLEIGTCLNETDDNFEFLLATNGDLFAIKKSDTKTETTEIYVLSAASKYKSFSLETVTCLNETNDDWDFALARDRDLVAIKKPILIQKAQKFIF